MGENGVFVFPDAATGTNRGSLDTATLLALTNNGGFKPNAKSYSDIIKTLRAIQAPNSIIKNIKRKVFNKYNTGVTVTNEKEKISVVCISKATSEAQFINTITHEAKHIQSHICKYYNVKEQSEDAAYLIGFIIQKMYSVFKMFI